MRYEVMRLMQFLFSLSLIVLAFGGGVFAGWYRWAPRATPRRGATGTDARSTADRSSWAEPAAWAAGAGSSSGAARSTLFSPVGEPSSRDEAAEDRSPIVLLAPGDAIDLRRRHPSTRAELAAVPELSPPRRGASPLDDADTVRPER